MKRNSISNIVLLIVAVSLFASCEKFEADALPMTPISVGSTETYSSLNENSTLTIPIKFTSPCDSGIASAGYKVVNNRSSNPNAVNLVQSPLVPISFRGNVVDTTINVPVRLGTKSVVIIIYDKAGKMSSNSVNIENVVPSTVNVKTLTDVVMSTDPADNQNFFSFYESTPVFGSSVALTKQSRIDFMAVNMGGGRVISTNAYGASSSYYDASKVALAGFSSLTYSFITANRTYVTRTNFDAIKTESDLAKFLNDSVIAITPEGGAYYNIINADRRVSDVWGVGTTPRGFIIGWGYRSHPTATAVILNEDFALVLVKSVTQKSNGQYTITFDIKGPATDQRAPYNTSIITPYSPYTL
jgi:hypothetical protein